MAVQPLHALNERHHRFIAYYLEDLNASRAAKRAGFSEASAPWIGYQLLQDPLIQEELGRQRDELAQTLHLTPELVLREYMRIAFAQLAHVADWDEAGLKFIPSDEIDPDAGAAIAEMTTIKVEFGSSGEGECGSLLKTTTKVKMHAKLRALDAIVKHLNLKLLAPPTGDGEGDKNRSVSDALSPEDLRRIRRDVYGLQDPD